MTSYLHAVTTRLPPGFSGENAARGRGGGEGDESLGANSVDQIATLYALYRGHQGGGWQATGAFILPASGGRLGNADVAGRFTLLQTWLSACYCF